jgi:ATP-dependent protease ClpP protease subunit
VFKIASACQTALQIVAITLALPISAYAAQSSEASKAVTVPLSKAVDQLEPIDAKQIQVILIKGPISRTLFSNMRQLLNQLKVMAEEAPAGEEFIPGKLIVLLDSRGGDGMAAMDIGRILRQANAHVFVTGECSSACVFLLASGVVRGAPTFTVGIHQARITMSSDAGVIKREVNIQDDPKAKALLEQFEKDAKVYLAEMGLPAVFFKRCKTIALRVFIV